MAAMHFGVITIHEPLEFAELGRILEDLGFESLFVLEHSHLPVERAAPWPYDDLPPQAALIFDPLVALAVVAGTTARLKLGTASA
jgi:alkanesulfonate monooxygenase SsuD/methylene tetrahydromethanopterin reductase-like flavin-dependent oxidoreductase (luciferase family)